MTDEDARLRKELDALRKDLKNKQMEISVLKSELEQLKKKSLTEQSLMKAKAAGTSRKKLRVLFPFTAIVKQDLMRNALILNAIYPEIGGVLIKGEKGTGKSVSVRGLVEVLPEIDVVQGCKFNCDPRDMTNLCAECQVKRNQGLLKMERRQTKVVDLPLNTTEDRLMGSIDIEKVLGEGTKAFDPGILADVHRGILYVDEINLLDDFVVDVLLDAAASGTVTVEREGISISHPSKFIIVGSMNPEEGELRPQLLDRLALQVEVGGIDSVDERMDIVRRREEFTSNALAFRNKFEPEQEDLRQSINRARKIMPQVQVTVEMRSFIARLALAYNVSGHRADIIIERTARAHAAFKNRTEVTYEDIEMAALLALPHRMRIPAVERAAFSPDALRGKMDQIKGANP